VSSVVVFLCGPDLARVATLAPDLQQELALRQIAARVLADHGAPGPSLAVAQGEALTKQIEATLGQDVWVVVLLAEPSRERREALAQRFSETVVVDWAPAPPFEASESPHLTVADAGEPVAALGEVFALLEGLGHLPFASQGVMRPEQEAEVVQRLKELGYL